MFQNTRVHNNYPFFSPAPFQKKLTHLSTPLPPQVIATSHNKIYLSYKTIFCRQAAVDV